MWGKSFCRFVWIFMDIHRIFYFPFYFQKSLLNLMTIILILCYPPINSGIIRVLGWNLSIIWFILDNRMFIELYWLLYYVHISTGYTFYCKTPEVWLWWWSFKISSENYYRFFKVQQTLGIFIISFGSISYNYLLQQLLEKYKKMLQSEWQIFM